MRVLVTGAEGFVGKNLCVALERLGNIELYKYDVENSIEDLEKFISNADIVYHLAGVNRPEKEDEYNDNADFTKQVCEFLIKHNNPVPIIFTSSTQAELDNIYGNSKKTAENYIIEYSKNSNAPVFIYRFPNVFGKWSRSNYNSAVATFCYNISHDLEITISDKSKMIEFVYIDDVVKCFIDKIENSEKTEQVFYTDYPTYKISLGDLADKIKNFKEMRSSLLIDDLSDNFTKYLYSTYLSFHEKDNFIYSLDKKTDDRGWLFELLKSKHLGQIFISKTKPGITRGNHYHDTKIEKFCVISGSASIKFRHIIDNTTMEYVVNDEKIQIVDIPPGYTHSIKNIGETDLMTIFWANEIFSQDKPDTFYLEV